MAEVELQQLGSYTISELLYESSTSRFYAGKQRKKNVIIQKLTLPLPEAEEKIAFLARAKQLKKLKDRTIIPMLEASFDGDYGYMVLEQIKSQPLTRTLTTGKSLAPDIVRLYISPIANALHYAHASRTIHGNLHPDNILIGERREILLTGFALTPPGFTPSLDDDTAAIPYMAPEQLNGHPTAASDQYALAVMTYEWLCHQRPYPAGERAQLRQQQQEPLLKPRSINSNISEALEAVLLKALALDPEQRFPHTQAFANAYLQALLGLPVRPPETRPRLSAVPSTPALHNRQQLKPTQPDDSKIQLISAITEIEDQPQPIQLEPKRSISRTTKSVQPDEQERLSTDTQEDKKRKIIAITTKAAHPSTEAPHSSLALDEDELEDDLELDDLDTSAKNSRLIDRVSEDLRQGGILSQSLPGYEERPAQIEMAALVSHAINDNVPAIIEAATGTGKSLAYLVPVVRSGQVAIISTANKALQEQLFYKDIPFVQKHIKHFEAALVKGVNNYICLDRVETERVGMQFYSKSSDFQHLYELINDPDTAYTLDGDFENLGFRLPADIRSRIATDSDQCAWSKCSFFDECYVRQMRERAERAQVIVVNHTLLLLDAAIGGFLLPERDVIILDEAHHLEEEATRSFTITINPAQIQTLLAQRMLKDHSQNSLQDAVMRAAQEMWLRLEQTTDLGFKGRANLERPLEEGLRLATTVSDLMDSMRKQRPKDLPEKEGQLYDKLLKRTQNLAEHIRTVFSVADQSKFVYYIERVSGSASRGLVLQASAAPLDVTAWLKERLFNKCNVISTSATLATIGPNAAKPADKGPNFSYFRKRVGLDPLERSDVLERILPLTFDYESNALLYVPRHLPAPTFGEGEEDYVHDLALEMYRLVKFSRGRAFLLFSSKRVLEKAYDWIAPHLSYPLLKQGETTRLELTRRFREEENAVLFGLKSFWEGVDIAGDTLSLVVIDKLPFDPPDDPVHEARVALMKAAGENWFGIYVLPQAVLRLKQGIGRLLRSHEDRGVMAILDTRLHTKGYGRTVLNALPPARRTTNIRDVERFFAEENPQD